MRLRGAAYVLPVTNVNPLSVSCSPLYEVILLSRKVASIPLVVIYQWLAEDGFLFTQLPQLEQTEYLRKKLNSPEWAYLKTSEGTF